MHVTGWGCEMTPKNWKLTAYTNNTWTDVVGEAAILASILVANTDPANAINVQLRLSGGAVILPASSVPASSSYALDLRSLNIGSGETLQLQASAAGINAIASGAV